MEFELCLKKARMLRVASQGAIDAIAEKYDKSALLCLLSCDADLAARRFAQVADKHECATKKRSKSRAVHESLKKVREKGDMLVAFRGLVGGAL